MVILKILQGILIWNTLAQSQINQTVQYEDRLDRKTAMASVVLVIWPESITLCFCFWWGQRVKDNTVTVEIKRQHNKKDVLA